MSKANRSSYVESRGRYEAPPASFRATSPPANQELCQSLRFRKRTTDELTVPNQSMGADIYLDGLKSSVSEVTGKFVKAFHQARFACAGLLSRTNSAKYINEPGYLGLAHERKGAVQNNEEGGKQPTPLRRAKGNNQEQGRNE